MAVFKRGALPDAPKITLSDALAAHAAANGLGEDVYRKAALARMWHHQEDGGRPQQAFDVFNRFSHATERRMKKLSEIQIGTPWDENDPQAAADFHYGHDMLASVKFVDEEGVSYDMAECRPISGPDMHLGVVFQDDAGQVWFHGVEGRDNAEYPSGEITLKRLSSDTPAGLKAALGGGDVTELMPFVGEIGIAASDVISQYTEAEMAFIRDDDPSSHSWKPQLAAAQAAAAAQLAREKNIGEIFDRFVDISKLQFLKEGLEYPISKDELSNHRRKTVYNTRSPINDMSEALMEAYRDAGYIKKCPNNGPRAIREMSKWNAWLSGKELDVYDKMTLGRAPGFDTLEKCFTAASVEIEMDKEKALSPNGKISYDDRVKFDLDEEEVDQEIALTVEKARAAFVSETLDPLMSRDTSTCQVTGKHLRVGGTLFAPVLTQFTKDYKEEVAPVVETPKAALHFELPMPTGELVMTDWLRMKGFKEGLLARVGGDDFYDINGAVGLDERMQDYFTKGGLAIVQVGNSSPFAYDDTAGVWRMGRVDEDYFYDDDGNRTGEVMPGEAWTTCTDLWANIFADRAVIVDILMASGEYESRESADAALLEYVDESYGASITKLDVDNLHVYAPTGHGLHTGSFKKKFRADELDYPKWRKDQYVLSVEPLTVDPDVVLETGWEAPAHEVSETPEPC